ncbi:serine/threonine protein kinase [Coemansia sp. BCRC 34301]|nr:serine/threonine protein kinase [Coemansia sp. BCRC 34301]
MLGSDGVSDTGTLDILPEPTAHFLTKAALVAATPPLAFPETGSTASSRIIAASSGNSATGAYAVDGKLSLSIRPAGWTLGLLGPSIRRLGAGTGGSVDLHRNPVSQQVVAVKTLRARSRAAETPTRPGRVPCTRQSRRVLMEMGIAMNVRHRNVVRTLEVIAETDSQCYLVQEACAIDLFALAQRRAVHNGGVVGMSEAEANGYFKQLAHGVQYLHSVGIAHRDLKLDNVCVTQLGVLKIVDFGCATLFRRRAQQQRPCPTNKAGSHHRHRGAAGNCVRAAPYSIPAKSAPVETCSRYVETLSTSVCGSEPYMAPELFGGGEYAAAMVDVWALGIIYFALRFTQFPWSAAQVQRDQGFRKFVHSPAEFYSKWFPAIARPSSVGRSGGSLPRKSACAANSRSLPSHQATGIPDAAAILRRIWDTNPASRADINTVVSDPWFLALGAEPF